MDGLIIGIHMPGRNQAGTDDHQVNSQRNQQEREKVLLDAIRPESVEDQLEETAEDDEEDCADFHYAQTGLAVMGVFGIEAHDEDAQPDQDQDDGPAVSPAFPIAGQVLDEHHQAEAADDGARDGQSGQRLATSEHPDEEEPTKADDDERPKIAQEWKAAKNLSEEGQEAEDDQNHPAHERTRNPFV